MFGWKVVIDIAAADPRVLGDAVDTWSVPELVDR